MGVEVRPATRETRHVFAALLEEARAWQRARGVEGWSRPFDDAWMLPRLERGELFLAWLDGEPVAAFRLLHEDRPFWGDREVGDSLYLHSFAVRRGLAGLGVGAAVIGRIVDRARAQGRNRVRLDCFLSSAPLIAYYERCGFASVGAVTVQGRRMNLMERAV